MNIEQKISLRNEIEKLEDTHHKEILKIIKKNNIVFSENKNGVFINLNYVHDNILNEIVEYIEYIKKQETYINKIEEIKNNYKEEFFQNE